MAVMNESEKENRSKNYIYIVPQSQREIITDFK